MKIQIINGPNLNLIGTREQTIYGEMTFDEYLLELEQNYPFVEFHYYQSNVEGELINKIQEVGFSFDAIVLNAGGYTHTSVALRDAIAAVTTPVVEVHMTNLFAREEFRHQSIIGAKCRGCISGFGLESYRLAVESFI